MIRQSEMLETTAGPDSIKRNRMFSFGLFSTHLPYLILGIVYLAFFGVNALSRLKDSPLFNKSEKELKIEYASSESEKSKSIDFEKAISQSEPAHIQEGTNPHLTCRLFLFPPGLSLASPGAFHGNSLFIRPPPILS